ncbi:MAG: hypothetical protein R3F54_24465 [Alphaproteobacteria bacterium]
MLERALALLLLTMASPLAAETAVMRHEVGPWPVVSRLIGYGERLWFANSVKGVNHNSADLYSLPIQGGSPRYEGHLFSQDAGDPVVHRGLLYWPLEDARIEPGIGAFDVTDGERWEHGLIPTEQAFHTHAMAVAGSSLYAAPSAWKASIARSDDGGAHWRTVYLHPTPERRVSRITSLVVTDHGVYGSLNAPEGRSLIRVDDGSGKPLPGWPSGYSHGLTVHQGSLFGIAGRADAGGIWRSDGEKSEKIWTPPSGWTLQALASDGERLWMAGDGADGASLWGSADGRDWIETARLDGGSPRDLLAYRGVIAVGGRGANDRGVLWILRQSSMPRQAPVPSRWPSLARKAVDGFDWEAAAARLDRLLADPQAYERRGEPLERALLALPQAGVPPDFYPDRLKSPMPSDPLPMFGGIVLDRMADFARWRLYEAMGSSRSGKVDPADILMAWDYTPNRPFKFFSTPEIAIWAAGRVGRAGNPILAALVRRLEDDATPLWLKGDAAGALFAITGERLGYDAKAWRGWLEGRS